jgi:class 3 adenylate cyclase
MCTLFAATRPERTSALVLYGTIAAGRRDENYPWAARQEVLDRFLATIQDGWGKGVTPRLFAPTIAGDPQQVQLWARFERRAVSPGGMRSLLEMLVDTDVREILPTIHVPTLVLHRSNDRATPVEGGRYIAQRIPGAKYVELRGEDHFPWIGDADAILDEIEEFLTGIRHRGDADRVLATVMFCDIVGSTECATRVGDRAWRDVLERFYEIMRGQLELFRGSEVDTAGDGFFAAFDGPARAVWCARACQQAVSSLGLAVRVGIHTGECEIIAKKIGGIAVHIGARIGAMAGPNEVLVSGTVKDLVVGSGLRFGDRGLHTLKGIPGQWRLFAAQK